MFKKCLVPILLIFLLISIVVIGAPTYVNIGPTTDFEGDVGVPSGSNYYINDVQITSDVLSDVAYIAMLDEAETITGNWVNTDNPWADDEVANDITIDLATLATTLTIVDNESTDESNAILFTSGGVHTGDLNIESDGDLVYNPSTGTLSATKFSGDGSELINIGEAAATSLSFTAKEENTGNIIKGQPVYVSGALAPAFPKIGLADCDDAAKVRLIGLAGEDIDQNTSGLVRRAGLLTGVDTLGATAVNPDDETWIAGDLLYVHTTAGGLTHTKPTSGRIIKAAYSLYGSNNADDLLVITHENPVYIACAPDEDIIFRMGDALGAKKVYFKDYANAEVAYIDSDGKADFTSLTLDTPLLIAEGGTNSGAALANDLVMISNAGAVVEGVVTVTELGRLDGLGGIIVTDVTECTDLEGTKLSIAGGVLNCTETDSVVGAVTGIVLSDGGGNITASAVADTLVLYIDGATNIPSGEAGFTYIKGTDTLNVVNIVCTSVTGALTGNADTCTTASAGDAAVDFFGAGVDAVTDTTECTDLEGTALSITAGVLNVTEADPTVDEDSELKAILVDEVTKTGDFTAGRMAKINNATGIIEMGTNTDTEVADAVTKKHTQNTDTQFDFYNALGSDHTWSGQKDTQPVGESVVFGDLLYFNWTDKEWKKAKADAYATTPAERIALESKSDGQTCLMLVKGYIRDESAFDFGASRIYLNDDTAGTCDDTAPAESGDQIQIVGTAIHADILFFNPSVDVGEI